MSTQEISDQKQLLIKRSESSVEITVGEPEMDTEEKPQTLQDPPSEPDQLDCSNPENIFCLPPLSKTQWCLLTITVIVTLVIALLVLIILVGLVASHDTRLRELETKVAVLEASNAELHYNAEKDQLQFRNEIQSKIIEASNQFSLLYLQTLSLVLQRKDLDIKVEFLSNRTDELETIVNELTRIKNTSRGGVSMEQQESSTPSQVMPPECKRVVLCVRAGRENVEVCGREPITTKQYKTIYDHNMFDRETPLELYDKCIDNDPEPTINPKMMTFNPGMMPFDPVDNCEEVHMCVDVTGDNGEQKRLCGGPRITAQEYQEILKNNIIQKLELKLHYSCVNG